MSLAEQLLALLEQSQGPYSRNTFQLMCALRDYCRERSDPAVRKENGKNEENCR